MRHNAPKVSSTNIDAGVSASMRMRGQGGNMDKLRSSMGVRRMAWRTGSAFLGALALLTTGSVTAYAVSDDVSFNAATATAIKIINYADGPDVIFVVSENGGNTTGLSTIELMTEDNLTDSLNGSTTTDFSVGATQTGTQSFYIEQKLKVLNIANPGSVYIDRSGKVETDEDGVNASSLASARTVVGGDATQSIINAFTGSSSTNALNQTQTITQRNEIRQKFFAGSFAFADDATVIRYGKTKAGKNGVNALSIATSFADVGSGIANSQSNTNSFTTDTTGNRHDVTQNQTVNQKNKISQLAAAIAVAGSGDVTVSVDGGNTNAGDSGVNAVTKAEAVANADSTSTQSNTNSATGTTTGDGSDVWQFQNVEQKNKNLALIGAGAAAFSGDVDVTSNGKTKAGEDGVNAASVATAEADASNSITQSNTNTLTAGTSGNRTGVTNGLDDAAIVQDQNVQQKNKNFEALLAGSLAVSGDVTVDRDGKTNAGENGVNAASEAIAEASVNGSVDQDNTNSATANTTGRSAAIYQGEDSQDVEQDNINAQAMLAASIASSGDVSVTQEGKTNAGEAGIDADSFAKAKAEVGSEVDQDNDNSLSASTTNGGSTSGSTLPYAPIEQRQTVYQNNFNLGLTGAAAVAFSGDVDVESKGQMTTGDEGVAARSEAKADAKVVSSVDQFNTNSTSADTSIGSISQVQAVEQENVNVGLTASIAGASAGDVTVTRQGHETKTGKDGVRAKSVAEATSEVESEVAQENTNEAYAQSDRSPIFQADTKGRIIIPIGGPGGQSVDQDNENFGFIASATGAYAGDVTVDSKGSTTSKGDGVTAESIALSTATVDSDVSQVNSNSLYGSTEEDYGLITQGQVAPRDQIAPELLTFDGDGQDPGVEQENLNLEVLIAGANARSGDVTVERRGATHASGYGIDAESVAVSQSAVESSVSQENSNAATAATSGNLAPIVQAPINAVIVERVIELFADGGQDVDQSNVNLQGQLAFSIATAGDVTVDSKKPMTAGQGGINANSIARSSAYVDSDVDQKNDNALSAQTEGDFAPIFQDQVLAEDGHSNTIEQFNLNGQLMAAASDAEAGDVTVTSKGPMTAKKEAGISAKSEADAVAGVKTNVTQANRNGPLEPENGEPEPVEVADDGNGDEVIEPVTAETFGNLSPIEQDQAAVQINANGQGQAAIAAAETGDVTVTKKGGIKSNKDDAINAASVASAQAGIENEISQTNDNNLSARTAGGVGEENGEPLGLSPITQDQTAVQANLNGQLMLSEADADSGNVVVNNTGKTEAGGDGIEAKSKAEAFAGIDNTATQENNNELSASATGPLSPTQQGQLALQINGNLDSGTADAYAAAGDVVVNQSKDMIVGDDGIEAQSKAEAGALVEQDAGQSNSNSVDGAGTGLAVQLQGALQVNANIQDGNASAEAFSQDVEVNQVGAVTAGADGIRAESSAQAAAGVDQNADQSNDNETSLAVEGLLDGFGSDIPLDLGLGLQGGLVGQLNLNIQSAEAEALAEADSVTVTSQQDPAQGNGIVATSSAGAAAAAGQGADQSNTNDANMELPREGLALGLQLGAALQANLNLQQAEASAEAIAGPVTVKQTKVLEAGKYGINATSEATAAAAVAQDVSQSNSDTKTIALAPVPVDETEDGEDGGTKQVDEEPVDPSEAIALQLEAVGQGNLSIQGGVATADAYADSVTVKKSGELTAGGRGIQAVSSAESASAVAQSADQENINTVDGTGGIAVAQVQFAGQLNANLQGGVAIAEAESGDVYVRQRGTASAGGKGIDAISSASAAGAVAQDASQSNENTATATLLASDGEPTNGVPDAPAVAQLDDEEDLRFAAQLQAAGQINANGQGGLAAGVASSDDVTVRSQNLTAGDAGVRAQSKADGAAAVAQSVTQSNENRAEATFEGQNTEVTVPELPEEQLPEGVGVEVSQQEGTDIALQGQLAGQANLNLQGGLAVAAAESGAVDAKVAGKLETGKAGINAKSRAEANSAVVQEAQQSNVNSAKVTFDGQQVDVDAAAEDSVVVGVQQAEDLNLALQGQAVGQANLNIQGGASVAIAEADDVTARQAGTATVGGDGIKAASLAEANSAVVQSAGQSNDNSAEADFGGQQADVQARSGVEGEPGEQEEEPIETGSSIKVGQFDGPDVAVQGQLVGQANLSGQGGASIATAFSDDVTVTSQNDPAGGTGILARSEADAGSAVVQTVGQENSNSAKVGFDGQQAELDAQAEGVAKVGSSQFEEFDLALQGQVIGQANLSTQRGLAVAIAETGSVLVNQSGRNEAGAAGIIARSRAEVEGAVVQEAQQANDNSAEATFEGNEIDVTSTTPDFSSEFDQTAGGGSDVALQGQLVGQINLNSQGGIAIAAALSDDVTVKQRGEAQAGGNGIVAVSVARAEGAVVQTAEQENSNSATASLFGGADNVRTFDRNGGGLNLALQGQQVGQINLSEQRGLAVAVASADEVEVKQWSSLAAGGNGIDANSASRATAPVVQTANQANDNSADVTFRGDQSSSAAQAGGGEQAEPDQLETNVGVGIQQFDGPDLAVQGQAVGQINLNEQGGLAISVAESDEVSVIARDFSAGGNGVQAFSQARADGAVVQTAEQSNSNSATATFEGDQANATAQADDAAFADVLQGGGGVPARAVESLQTVGLESLDLALQGQAVGQINLNGQRGAAISVALADTVNVKQSREFEAGKAGITAESRARAEGALVQTAQQSNDNSAEATFEGSQADASATAGEVRARRSPPGRWSRHRHSRPAGWPGKSERAVRRCGCRWDSRRRDGQSERHDDGGR